MKVKQIIAIIFGFSILLGVVFTFSACGGNDVTDDNFSGDVTISFVSNGGTAVASITVPNNSMVPKPADPTLPGGFNNLQTRFRGWYWDDGDFLDPFIFTERLRLKKDMVSITLYGDWGYRPGDTGPGTGMIFYRSDAGFTVEEAYGGPLDNRPKPWAPYEAHYLEAAPRDETGAYYWVLLGGSFPSEAFTGTYSAVIGGGRRNTQHILQQIPTAPAASACRNASYGGLQDWYLPSRHELNELYKARKCFENLPPSPFNLSTKPQSNRPFVYWSSNQYDYQFAFNRNFNTGGENTNRNNQYSVRAIRAF